MRYLIIHDASQLYKAFNLSPSICHYLPPESSLNPFTHSLAIAFPTSATRRESVAADRSSTQISVGSLASSLWTTNDRWPPSACPSPSSCPSDSDYRARTQCHPSAASWKLFCSFRQRQPWRPPSTTSRSRTSARGLPRTDDDVRRARTRG